MKVGLISDVHGNRIALEAVLEDLPAVDSVACTGDIVGYNPWPADCVDSLRTREIQTVLGNHDRAVLEKTAFRFNEQAQAGVELARTQLTDAQMEWLAELPDERHIADGQIKLVHGHPDDPDRYTYPADFSPRLLADEDVLVLGHTHVQHVERYADGIVLNPGSVGQPRDGDPRAAYAVVDLEAMTVDCRRVAYDIEAVKRKITEAGLPERLGSRLARGQ